MFAIRETPFDDRETRSRWSRRGSKSESCASDALEKIMLAQRIEELGRTSKGTKKDRKHQRRSDDGV